jgi:hypothetical protein
MVRANSCASLSNSGSEFGDDSIPFRIFKRQKKMFKFKIKKKRFTFAFFRRLGESFRQIAQPLIKTNNSRKFFLQFTFHPPLIKSDDFD